jgi:hypothetical protein
MSRNRQFATTEELWSSYQELGNLRAVARRHGYSQASFGSIATRLHNAGYSLHEQSTTKATRRIPVDELRDIYLRTGSYVEVARHIGSTPDAVRMRITRAERAGVR